jgi:monoamine oxidase
VNLPHSTLLRCLTQIIAPLQVRTPAADSLLLAERTSLPPDSASGWSRRDALRGLAIGAAAAASWSIPLPAADAPRIAVVGAGISGMVAALTLQDAGVPCIVYESSGRIGGRMHSNHSFWADDQVTEWCGEFVDTIHHLMRHLAHRFDLPLDDVIAAQPPHSRETLYFLSGYYTIEELAADLKPLIPLLQAQFAAVGPTTTYNHFTRAGYHFDHMNAYEWIERYVPGGHTSRLGRLMDVSVVTECGMDSSLLPALNLICYFNSPAGADCRYHIRGGNQQLPLAISQSLPSGTVKLGWRLESIEARADGKVALGFSTPGGSQELVFDAVILTLPFSVLRGLDYSKAGFDALKITAITQLGYGTNSKISLQFDDRYWNQLGPWGIGNGITATDLPIQSTWDSSLAEPGLNGLITNYTGGTPGAAFRPDRPYSTSLGSPKVAQYASQFLSQLENLWPGVSAHYTGRATLSYPTGDPNLLGSYSAYQAGQTTLFAGYEGVPQGTIHFGGEHCSVNFQGFMEGGAEEGRRAASEVLHALHA